MTELTTHTQRCTHDGIGDVTNHKKNSEACDSTRPCDKDDDEDDDEDDKDDKDDDEDDKDNDEDLILANQEALCFTT